MILPDPNLLIDELALQLGAQLSPNCAFIGVRTGGLWVAERLAAHFKREVGAVTVTFHRDDFSRIGLHGQSKPTSIPFDVNGRDLVLVDDVLFTGRTIRAALNELFDFGRPASVKLAVLLDRGGLQLPFSPDAIGAKLPLQPHERFVLSETTSGQLQLALETDTETA